MPIPYKTYHNAAHIPSPLLHIADLKSAYMMHE